MRKFLYLALVLIFALAPLVNAYDPEYFNQVVGRKAVSLGDGCQLIMHLLELEDKHPHFESQMEFLKANDVVKKSILDKPQDVPLQRGELAYMLCKTLKLKGGFKARLLGMNERFAMEELTHWEIMREGHKLDLVTGQELVIIMTQAAQHILSRMERGK